MIVYDDIKVIMFLIKKVIAAEGEHKASRALRHAAEVITGNPAALQVLFKIIITIILTTMTTKIITVMMTIKALFEHHLVESVVL